jgi:hypothetical protein
MGRPVRARGGEVQSNVTNSRLYRQIILPGVFPIGVIILTIALIVLIGETLLASVNHPGREIERRELWVGTLAALAILGFAAVLVTRPKGSLGKLDEPLAIGKRPLLADPLPPVDVYARHGTPGTVEDIGPGYLLYARNGQIGVVREVLRDVPAEVRHLRRGFLYAQGVHGANDQMWVPVEAVSAIYPETRTAFLAIAGDEIEAYGWQNPPISFNLHRTLPENRLY